MHIEALSHQFRKTHGNGTVSVSQSLGCLKASIGFPADYNQDFRFDDLLPQTAYQISVSRLCLNPIETSISLVLTVFGQLRIHVYGFVGIHMK